MNRVTQSCIVMILAAFEALADGNSNFEVFANLNTEIGRAHV